MKLDGSRDLRKVLLAASSGAVHAARDPGIAFALG